MCSLATMSVPNSTRPGLASQKALNRAGCLLSSRTCHLQALVSTT